MAVNISAKFYAQDPTTVSGWEDLSKIVFTSPNLPSPSSAGTRSNILPGEGEIGLWYEDLSNMYRILSSQPDGTEEGHYKVWDGFVIGENIDLSTFDSSEIVISGTKTYLEYKSIYNTGYLTGTVGANNPLVCVTVLSGTNSDNVAEIFETGYVHDNDTIITTTSGSSYTDGYYFIGSCGDIYTAFGLSQTYTETPIFNTIITKNKVETLSHGWIGSAVDDACFIDFTFNNPTRVVSFDLSNVLWNYVETGNIVPYESTSWSGTEHVFSSAGKQLNVLYEDSWALSDSLWKSEATVTVSGCDSDGVSYCYGIDNIVSDNFTTSFDATYGVTSITVKARNNTSEAWTTLYDGAVSSTVIFNHENYYTYYRLSINGGMPVTYDTLTEVDVLTDATITISGTDSTNYRPMFLSGNIANDLQKEYKVSGTTNLNGWFGFNCCDNIQDYDALYKNFYIESPEFNYIKFIENTETKTKGWVGGTGDCYVYFEFTSPKAIVRLSFDDVTYTISGTHSSHIVSSATTWSGTTTNYTEDSFSATISYEDTWEVLDGKWLCDIANIDTGTSECNSGCMDESYGLNVVSKVSSYVESINYTVNNIVITAGSTLATCDTVLYSGTFSGLVNFNSANTKYKCYKLKFVADTSIDEGVFNEVPVRTMATVTISGLDVSELNSGLLNSIYDNGYIFTSNTNIVQTSGIAAPTTWIGYECLDNTSTNTFDYYGLHTENPYFNYNKEVTKVETRTTGWVGGKTVGDECYLQFEFDSPIRIDKMSFDGVYYQRESLTVNKEFTGPATICSGITTTIIDGDFSTNIYCDTNWVYDSDTGKWSCGVTASGTTVSGLDSVECYPTSYGFNKVDSEYEAPRYVKEYVVTNVTIKAGDASDNCTDILYDGVFDGEAVLNYPSDTTYKFYKIYLNSSSNDDVSDINRKDMVYDTQTFTSSSSTQYREYKDDYSSNVFNNNKDRLNIGIGYSTDYYGDFSTITFNNINIPRGATITDAYLKVHATSNSYDSSCVDCEQEYINFYIYAINGAGPTTASGFYNIPLNTNIAALRIDSNWQVNDYNFFKNLNDSIQGVINSDSWESGNQLTLLIRRNMQTASKTDTVDFYSPLSAYKPMLYVSWGVENGYSDFDTYEKLSLSDCTITTSDIDSSYNLETMFQEGTVCSGYDSSLSVSGTTNIDAWFEILFSDNSAINDFDYKNVVLERPEVTYSKTLSRTEYKDSGWLGVPDGESPFIQFAFDSAVRINGLYFESIIYNTIDKVVSYNYNTPTWSGANSTFNDGIFSATVNYEDSWTVSGTNYITAVGSVSVSEGDNTDCIIKCYGVPMSDELEISDVTTEYSVNGYTIKAGNTPETCTNIIYTTTSGTPADRVYFDNDTAYIYYRVYLNTDNNTNPEPIINSYSKIDLDYDNKVSLSSIIYDVEDMFGTVIEATTTIPEYTWTGASTVDIETTVCWCENAGVFRRNWITFEWPFIVNETLSGSSHTTGGWVGNPVDIFVEFDYPELVQRMSFDTVAITNTLSGTQSIIDSNGYPNGDDYAINDNQLTFDFYGAEFDWQRHTYSATIEPFVNPHFISCDYHTATIGEGSHYCEDLSSTPTYTFTCNLNSSVDRSVRTVYTIDYIIAYGRNSSSESWVLINEDYADSGVFILNNISTYKYYKFSISGDNLGFKNMELFRGTFDSSLVTNSDSYYSEIDCSSGVTVTTEGFSGENHPESIFRSGYICTDRYSVTTLSGIDDNISVGYYINHALNSTTGNYRFTDIYFVSPEFYYTKSIAETESKEKGWLGRSNDSGYIQFAFDSPRKVAKLTFDSVNHSSNSTTNYTYIEAAPTWSGGTYTFSSSNSYGDISAVLHFDDEWLYDAGDDKFYCTITGVSDFFSSYDSSGAGSSEWDYENCLGLNRTLELSNSINAEYKVTEIIVRASNDFSSGYIELYNGTFDGEVEFFNPNSYTYYRIYMVDSCADNCPDCLSVATTKEINLRNSVEISSDNSSSSALMALFESGYLYENLETSSTTSGTVNRTIQNRLRYCLNSEGVYNYEENYNVVIPFAYSRDATTIATKDAGLTSSYDELNIYFEFPQAERIVKFTGNFVDYDASTSIVYTYDSPTYSGGVYNLSAASVTLGNEVNYSSAFTKWYAEDVDSVTITASGCADGLAYEHTSYGVAATSTTTSTVSETYGIDNIIVYGRNSESDSWTILYNGMFDGTVNIAEAMCDFYKYYRLYIDAGTSYDGVGLSNLKAYKYACDDDYYSYGVSNLKLYTYSSDIDVNDVPYGIKNLSLYTYKDYDNYLYGISNLKMYEYTSSKYKEDYKFGVSNLKLIEYSEDQDNSYGISGLTLKDYAHDNYSSSEDVINYIFADNGAVYEILSKNVTVTSGGNYVAQIEYLSPLNDEGDNISTGATIYTYDKYVSDLPIDVKESVVIEVNSGECYDCYLTAWDDSTHSTTSNNAILAGEHCRINAHAFYTINSEDTPNILDVFEADSTTNSVSIFKEVINKKLKGRIISGGEDYWYGDFNMIARQNDTTYNRGGDYIVFKPYLVGIDDTIPAGIHDFIIAFHYSYT